MQRSVAMKGSKYKVIVSSNPKIFTKEFVESGSAGEPCYRELLKVLQFLSPLAILVYSIAIGGMFFESYLPHRHEVSFTTFLLVSLPLIAIVGFFSFLLYCWIFYRNRVDTPASECVREYLRENGTCIWCPHCRRKLPRLEHGDGMQCSCGLWIAFYGNLIRMGSSEEEVFLYESGVRLKKDYDQGSVTIYSHSFTGHSSSAPLYNRHHQEIVRRCYWEFRDIPLPKQIIQYSSWHEVKDDPALTQETLIFVDGGITSHDVDVGKAALVNDGGIVKHQIKCGIFYKDGGIVEISPICRLEKNNSRIITSAEDNAYDDH